MTTIPAKAARDQIEIGFDEHGHAWVMSTAQPSTMCKVIEEQRRGAPVLECVQVPSCMTRRMVRPASREEVEQWRQG